MMPKGMFTIENGESGAVSSQDMTLEAVRRVSGDRNVRGGASLKLRLRIVRRQKGSLALSSQRSEFKGSKSRERLDLTG